MFIVLGVVLEYKLLKYILLNILHLSTYLVFKFGLHNNPFDVIIKLILTDI